MSESSTRRNSFELKELVAEASQALTQLDADRLEELVLCCQELNRELLPICDEDCEPLACQSREAASDMAIFARVLDATRENMKVMRRLFDLRAGRIEYGPGGQWTGIGSRHGND